MAHVLVEDLSASELGLGLLMPRPQTHRVTQGVPARGALVRVDLGRTGRQRDTTTCKYLRPTGGAAGG